MPRMFRDGAPLRGASMRPSASSNPVFRHVQALVQTRRVGPSSGTRERCSVPVAVGVGADRSPDEWQLGPVAVGGEKDSPLRSVV
mmetsp:Transcript_17876/g.46206  ORF Transcript_17876/g.46206 Transcript_17876/m.46206 type:complete len:85 (-) Transcript_17876:157-411(-)